MKEFLISNITETFTLMLRVIVWHIHTRSPIKTARILLLSIPESFKLSIREWQKLASYVLCIHGYHIRFKQTRIDTAFESHIDQWPDPPPPTKNREMIFGIIFMWMRIVHSPIHRSNRISLLGESCATWTKLFLIHLRFSQDGRGGDLTLVYRGFHKNKKTSKT